jgi:hypothetical protein
MKPTFALSGVWIAVSLINLGVYGAGVAVRSDGQFFSQHRQQLKRFLAIEKISDWRFGHFVMNA